MSDQKKKKKKIQMGHSEIVFSRKLVRNYKEYPRVLKEYSLRAPGWLKHPTLGFSSQVMGWSASGSKPSMHLCGILSLCSSPSNMCRCACLFSSSLK